MNHRSIFHVSGDILEPAVHFKQSGHLPSSETRKNSPNIHLVGSVPHRGRLL